MRHRCIQHQRHSSTHPSHAYYSLCHMLVAPSPSSPYCLVSTLSHSYLPSTHQHPTVYMNIYNARPRKHVHVSTHTYVDTGVSTFLSGGECNEVIPLLLYIIYPFECETSVIYVYSIVYSVQCKV